MPTGTLADLLTLALAAAALGGAVGAIALAAVEWFELKAAKGQIEDEKRKIERLTELVATLRAQLSLLEKQAKTAEESLKVQEADLALRREQLEWDKKGPLAKAGSWWSRWKEERKTRRGSW